MRENEGRYSISNEPNEALKISITSTPAKYLASLDKPTRARITAKLEEIAKSPYDPRLSYPLVGQTKRSSRVGGYRILFEIVENELIVSDIGPRGQIYKRLWGVRAGEHLGFLVAGAGGRDVSRPTENGGPACGAPPALEIFVCGTYPGLRSLCRDSIFGSVEHNILRSRKIPELDIWVHKPVATQTLTPWADVFRASGLGILVGRVHEKTADRLHSPQHSGLRGKH